jgi:phosphoribosylglycinamide formyltransferase 1
MIKLNIGFLASHNGSNMQAIIDSCKSGYLNANLCAVISNNSQSGAIERAKLEGIPYYHISSKTHPGDGAMDNAIVEIFDYHKVDTIVLAGYMKKIGNIVLEHFKGRVLNIHPALLPKYGGEGMYGSLVHEAVLRAGEKFSGVTVHLVDPLYDHGRIVAQRTVPVFSDDTLETLSARVLEQEHSIYSETLQKIAEGIIII